MHSLSTPPLSRRRVGLGLEPSLPRDKEPHGLCQAVTLYWDVFSSFRLSECSFVSASSMSIVWPTLLLHLSSEGKGQRSFYCGTRGVSTAHCLAGHWERPAGHGGLMPAAEAGHIVSSPCRECSSTQCMETPVRRCSGPSPGTGTSARCSARQTGCITGQQQARFCLRWSSATLQPIQLIIEISKASHYQ